MPPFWLWARASVPDFDGKFARESKHQEEDTVMLKLQRKKCCKPKVTTVSESQVALQSVSWVTAAHDQTVLWPHTHTVKVALNTQKIVTLQRASLSRKPIAPHQAIPQATQPQLMQQ